jgi:alpha-L-fucosidase
MSMAPKKPNLTVRLTKGRPAALLAVAGLLLGGMLLAGAPASATPPTAGPTASPPPSAVTPLLKVGFGGSFHGDAYATGPGEVIRGTLARHDGAERLRGHQVELPGGDSGLSFTPAEPLNDGGHLTRNVVVEVVARRTADWVPSTTLVNLGGGAFYRYRADDSYVTEAGFTRDDGKQQAAQALGVPSTGFRHIALVYQVDGAGAATLTSYVDGCQAGPPQVLTAPAAVTSPAVGFGMDPAAGRHGLPSDLTGIAVSTFTGSFGAGDFQLKAPRQQPIKGPGNRVTLSPCDSRAEVIDKATEVLPTQRQIAYQQREFEAFLHFGLNTFTGGDGVEVGDGLTPPSAFDPTHLDTAQWVKSLKDAGVTTAVLVTKHHDGFVNWQSRYTDYGVMSAPWQGGHGDVVREFVNAAHAAGMKVGFYLSPADMHQWAATGIYNNGSAWKPATIPTLVRGDDRAAAVRDGRLPSFRMNLDDYNRYYTNQLYELLTQYGPLDEVWLDGNNAIKAKHPQVTITEHYAYGDWYKMIRTLQPNAVIETGPRSQPPDQSYAGPDVRWVGSNAGSREEEWNILPMNGDPASQVGVSAVRSKVFATDDQLLLHDYLEWIPAMADTSIRPGWFYHPSEDTKVKSTQQLEQLYEDTVGRNSVLLLNVPPDRGGVLNPIDVERLHELGEWSRSTFGTDLARAAAVTTGTGARDGRAVVDGDDSTYWTPRSAADRAAPELDLDLGRPATFDLVELREPIARGQRMSSFAVDAWRDGGWVQVASGSTIGYRRLLHLDAPVTAQRVRLRVLGARATPKLSSLAVFRSAG